jgi:hypothetical protein
MDFKVIFLDTFLEDLERVVTFLGGVRTDGRAAANSIEGAYRWKLSGPGHA